MVLRDMVLCYLLWHVMQYYHSYVGYMFCVELQYVHYNNLYWLLMLMLHNIYIILISDSRILKYIY